MSPKVTKSWDAPDLKHLDDDDQGVANCSPPSSEEGLRDSEGTNSPSHQSDSGGDDSAKENRDSQNNKQNRTPKYNKRGRQIDRSSLSICFLTGCLFC